MISARKGVMLDKLLEIAAFEELSEQLEAFQTDADDTEHPVSHKLETHLRRAFRRQRRDSRRENRNKNQVYRTLRAAAIAVAVFLAVSFSGMMTVEAVRAEVYNVIVEIKDKFFSVFFTSEDDVVTEHDTIESYGIYEPTYIPDGFDSASETDMGAYFKITYRSGDGLRLNIFQAPLPLGNAFDVDGEKRDIKQFESYGYSGISFRLVEDDLVINFILKNTTHAFHIFGEVSEADMERIIEGLVLREP